MNNLWEHLYLFGITFITFIISAPTIAATPIMIITPNKTQLTLIQSDNTLQFTAKNNTGHSDPKKGVTLSQLSIYPGFNAGDQVKKATSIENNSCVNAILPPGSSCQFNITITANNNLPNTFILSPRICAFNDATCSQPDINNRVAVTVDTILAISDMHLDNTNYQPITYGEDTNVPLWKSTLSEITTLINHQVPRFIVFTGDIPDHGPDFPQPNPNQQQDIMVVLTDLSNLEAIKKNNIPIFYAVGNNDSLITDYGEFFDASQNHNLFYLDPEHSSPAKRGWPTLNANPDCSRSPTFACTYTTTSPMPADHASDMANVQIQGYYSAYPLGSTIPLRLISLNSVIFSRNYLYPNVGSQTQLNEAQAEMDWLAAQLDSAEKLHESVYIIMHIPVGMDAFSNQAPYFDLWNTTLKLRGNMYFRDYFLAIVTAHKNIIRAILSGHTHEDELRGLYPNQSLQSMDVLDVGIPGITPNHKNNPGIQIYGFNKSFQLTNVKTYYTTPVPSGWTSFSFQTDYNCPPSSTIFTCMSINILQQQLPIWKLNPTQPNPYSLDYPLRNLTFDPSPSTWEKILDTIQVVPISCILFNSTDC